MICVRFPIEWIVLIACGMTMPRGLLKDLLHIYRNFSLSDIEFISLDNDLGEGRLEGYKVLDWLEDLQEPIPFGIHIHTANPVARERMRAIIQRNGWKEVF